MTYRILTVCTGNICRSPMAEVVLQKYADQAGADVEVDSAAVSSYEVGNPIDPRAQKILRRGGYRVPPRGAQQITVEDIEDYDLILPMTREHQRDINRLAQRVAPEKRAEVRLWKEFAAHQDGDLDVPDPWYGGVQDFVDTLATLEDAADNIVAYAEQDA